MPTYDYHCDSNGRTVEVRHPMSATLRTWGELCALLEMETGDTPVDMPVRRLITGGGVLRREHMGSGQAPPCESGGPCCGGGLCEM